MPNIRSGIVYIRVNGVQVTIAGEDIEIDPGLDASEPLIGMDRSLGYKSTPRPASISFSARDHDELEVGPLLRTENATVTAEMLNGKTWVLRNARQVGEGTVNPVEATIALRFLGPSIEEQR